MNARNAPARGFPVRVALAALTLVGSLLAAPALTLAAGTGDDPDCPPDALTAREARERRGLESRLASEVAERGKRDTKPAKDGKKSDSITSEGLIVPSGQRYKYLWTPTHAQERSYWCGPASVQVIDDYFGAHSSQSTIAKWLGTTSAGTAFTKVDDALRYFARKSYYYYGRLTQTALWLRVEHSILDHGQPLAADVSIKGSVWPYYVYDHAGHIVPIEGFDWRYSKIRLNDVYPENRYRSGGGATLGHRTYARYILWDGISRHWQRAVVAAP